MRNEKGITLIALIITILVLLIIIGISVKILTGDNGILNKAQTSKSETEKTSEIEKMSLKIQGLILNKNGKAKLTDLNDFSNLSSSNYDNEVTMASSVKDTDSEAQIQMDNYTFTINSSLQVTSAIITQPKQDIYLYKKGDLCTGITNGWDKYVQGYGAQITFDADKITMQTLNINYWGHCITTTNAINLNNYQKIYLEYDSSSGYYTSAWNGSTLHFYVLSADGGTVVKSINSNPSTVDKIIELDISDLKGLYKIQVDPGSFVQANIYNVWIKQ